MKTVRFALYVVFKLLAIGLSVIGFLAWMLAFGAFAFTSPLLAGAALVIRRRRR